MTQQMLAASYSLLKLQLDEIVLSNETNENPNYFWFVFYFEDTVNRIFKLNDLLWNLVKFLNKYNHEENGALKKKVKISLKNNGKLDLIKLLETQKFETKLIRNSSIHNTKPFLYKGIVTVKDGMIYGGQGSRKFELDKDMPKLEADIKFIGCKYKKFIEELKLDVN